MSGLCERTWIPCKCTTQANHTTNPSILLIEQTKKKTEINGREKFNTKNQPIQFKENPVTPNGCTVYRKKKDTKLSSLGRKERKKKKEKKLNQTVICMFKKRAQKAIESLKTKEKKRGIKCIHGTSWSWFFSIEIPMLELQLELLQNCTLHTIVIIFYNNFGDCRCVLNY